MRPPKKKPTAPNLKNWRVSVLRSRALYLGNVQAATEQAAHAAAADEFGLDEDQRRCLVVRED